MNPIVDLLFPPRASTVASEVDALYSTLGGVTVFFVVTIALMMIVLGVRYRRRLRGHSQPPLPPPLEHRTQTILEVTWTVIPLVIALGLFGWSAKIYFKLMRAPADAMEILVIGKRWMWKFQHLEGRREMNELHVPLGRKVRLRMASEDTIHSFYVPAFRIKHDVLPGRYTTVWFEGTLAGRFRIFCAEFCGTRHSRMTGWVEVMEPSDYEAWLAGGTAGETAVQAGERIFRDTGCPSCHRDVTGGRGPVLAGVYGTSVELEGGGSVVADESYLRESILLPATKVVKGFQPIMPPYQGTLSEESVMQLVAYLRSLQGAQAPAHAPTPAPAPDAEPTPAPVAPPAGEETP
jgi:cytochrome c oxidase subunit 2